MENPRRFATFYFCDPGIARRSCAPAIRAIVLLAFCPATFLSAQNLPDAPQSQLSAQQAQDKGANPPSAPSTQPGSESADKKGTSAAPEATKSDKNSGPEQSKRLMWVVPNFGAVTANTQV